MLNQIFANLATGFAATFGAPFQDVVAVWPGTAVFDTGGSITTPGTPVELECKAQFDVPTEQMRADPAFLERDMRLLVLTATLDGTLDSAASVVVASGEYAGTWSLESVQGDPAGIGWECRARRIAA
ncbi:MAG TPA: hypothetical protein PK823_09370 [Novosphingobium sp.]|nr:hypothetical protein [Novosphingobium sp.]